VVDSKRDFVFRIDHEVQKSSHLWRSRYTRYELDGPGIESRWERDLPHLSRPAVEPSQRPIDWILAQLRGKKPWRGLHHPHPI